MSVRAILGLERTDRLSETIHTCNQNIVYSPQSGQSCGSWMPSTNSSKHLPHWNGNVSRQVCARLFIEVFRCPHVDPYPLLHLSSDKRHVRAQCQKGPGSRRLIRTKLRRNDDPIPQHGDTRPLCRSQPSNPL